MAHSQNHYKKYFSAIMKPQISNEAAFKTPAQHHYSRPYFYSQASQMTPMDHQQPDHIFSDEVGVVYGTNIVLSQVMLQIERFILNYQGSRLVDDQMISQRIYRNQLSELQSYESTVFSVDGSHIKQYDVELYLKLMYYPAQMISCFDQVIKDIFQKYFIQPETNPYTRSVRTQKSHKIMMGITNLSSQERLCLKQLQPVHIGRLVMIKGLVIRQSQIFPQLKRAFFRCGNCQHEVTVDLQNAKVRQPQKCDRCHKEQSFELVHNLSQYTDKQYVKIQELPQMVMEGQTPQSISVLAYDSNVDRFRPGDRVEIIGIYRATPVKIDRMMGGLRSVFNTYIDLISTTLLQENQFRIATVKTSFTDDEIHLFNKVAMQQIEGVNNPSLQTLINSFAPAIYSHQKIKKGILTQLFGGTKKTFKNWGRAQVRSDINICIVGDPSTAKSQFLNHVTKIAPRCVYTNGRGASAVGLTANVRRDMETKQFVLESGALVMSDQGICCIDQFDKMDDNARTILLQAMQQQTLSIAKAGIVCSLNTRTAILAAANPRKSKYDTTKSIVENINLPHALLSRFDLIYILLDLANQQLDSDLARHILDMYTIPNANKITKTTSQNLQKQSKSKAMTLTTAQLARYITFAKEYIHPVISQQAGQKLIKEYTSLRALGQSKNTIMVTVRQLESLIRISQAFAKMRLSKEVSCQDVDEAVRLIEEATLSSAMDPDTGIVNLDIISTGRSAARSRKIVQFCAKIRQVLLANDAKYRSSTSLQKFKGQYSKLVVSNQKIPDKDWQEAFRMLQTEDLVAIFGSSKSNLHFKLSVSNYD